MNRKELCKKIAAETKMPLNQVENAVDCLISNIKRAVAKGEDAQIFNFGSFVKVIRKARKGFNPQNGTPVAIPEAATVKFKISQKFKDMVRK